MTGRYKCKGQISLERKRWDGRLLLNCGCVGGEGRVVALEVKRQRHQGGKMKEKLRKIFGIVSGEEVRRVEGDKWSTSKRLRWME